MKVVAKKIATVSIFNSNGSYHMPTTKSTLFTVRKDEWNTKEDTSKSTKNAYIVHTVEWQKVLLGLKQHQTAKKIKFIALVIVKHQSVRQFIYLFIPV